MLQKVLIFLANSLSVLHNYFDGPIQNYFQIYSKTVLSKILDTDLKIVLLDHQNNFVGTLNIMLQKILIF